MKTSIVKPAEAPVDYQLRRSERAKKTRIVVSAGKVEVVAPVKVPEQRIKAFVHAQQDWIQRALRRVRERSQSAKPLAPAHYSDGVKVPYRGRSLPLIVQTIKCRSPKVSLLTDERLLVHVPDFPVSGTSELIKSALQHWMKQQARIDAQTYIDRHAPRHNLLPRSLRIKTQKSRWGSCGPQNDINLNWLLMLAPPVVMEYVVVHELCHIRHKNHSQDFWDLVSLHMPEYREHRKWLKQHGASVMRGL